MSLSDNEGFHKARFRLATLARFGTIIAINLPVPPPINRMTGSGNHVIAYKMNTPSHTGQNFGPKNASLNVGALIAAANVYFL